MTVPNDVMDRYNGGISAMMSGRVRDEVHSCLDVRCAETCEPFHVGEGMRKSTKMGGQTKDNTNLTNTKT